MKTPKYYLLSIQSNPDKALYWSEETGLVFETGRELDSEVLCEVLNWKFIMNNSLKLGKCGELYAKHLLETAGYDVAEPLIDDHGIDLLAIDENGNALKVQVKTVKAGSYTFIREDKMNYDDNFIVLYIRVDDAGVPHVFAFPSYVWPTKSETDITYSYGGRFTYHPYAGEGQTSPAEYGISGATKYYAPDDEFCIDTENIWECDAEKLKNIVG